MKPPVGRHVPARRALVLAAALLALSCRRDDPGAGAGSVRCETPEVRELVERLGERMRQVSLQAPDSIRQREMRTAYASIVTEELLDAWMDDPDIAPGRRVSSPWPDRIEIHEIETADSAACRVEGEVIHVTSVEETRGGAAQREPVSLLVRREDAGWRVAGYRAGPETSVELAEPGTSEAADVIRRYYAAIAAGDYTSAHVLWADSGRASGQTLEAFAAGYRETARVDVEVGEPGRVDPAAGSRFVEIPVVVRAVTRAGEQQRFEGSYVLRRSIVDGASEQQREWRIHSADLRAVRRPPR